MVSDSQFDQPCERLFNDLRGQVQDPDAQMSNAAPSIATIAQLPKPLESPPIEPPSPPGKRGSFMSWIVLLCFFALAGLSASFYSPWSSPKSSGSPMTVSPVNETTESPPDYSTVKIEDIQAGDFVYAYNPETGQVEQQRVLQTFERTTYHLRLLDFVDEEGTTQRIETTDEHPFWVVEREDFVEARDLQIGDSVQGPDGELQRLAASVREVHPEGVAVYNFEVESLHDYYVLGKETRGPPILVHNRCAAAELPQLKGKSEREISKILDRKGFTRTRVSNSPARNETWKHADGSEVRVHPYGNQSQAPYRSANNAHVHKQDPLNRQLNDRGIPSQNASDTHIGIKNPSDLPSIRGRPHGAGNL